MHENDFPFFGFLKAAGSFTQAPLVLLDVGCKGGIYYLCHFFAPHLEAHGFELSQDEVVRLEHAANKPSGAHFHFMKCIGPEKDMGGDADRSSDFFARTSAAQISAQMGVYQQAPVATPLPEEITLDAFAARQKLSAIDFIKTDTDGFDFSILKGAVGLLKTGVLGLQVECAINGQQSDDANLLRNTDRLLQANGFSLFDMQLFRYSRSILPQPFVTPDPAQTEKGQVSWCDAIYFRDLAAPDYEVQYGFTPTIAQVLKLAACYEIFGFPDCAAELLFKYRDRLPLPLAPLLDALTPRHMGKLSYEEYMATFKHLMQGQKIYPFGRIKIR